MQDIRGIYFYANTPTPRINFSCEVRKTEKITIKKGKNENKEIEIYVHIAQIFTFLSFFIVHFFLSFVFQL